MNRCKIVATYSPQMGKEEELLEMLKGRVYEIASSMGATKVDIVIDQAENKIYASGTFTDRDNAQRLSDSKELEEITSFINQICREPLQRELFDIAFEEAA